MIMTSLFKCFFKNGAIGIVILYNSIVSIIDIFTLIVSIILLSTNNTFAILIGTIFLVLAAIALPCVCCGGCYVLSLFNIQNSLNIARFMGFCNFCFMLFTLILMIQNEDGINAGFNAFFFILNCISLASVLFLCTINCGFEQEPSIDNEIEMRHIPEQLTLDNVVYPVPTMEQVSHPAMNNCVVIELEQLPSAPSPSNSVYELEGRPTLR